jgi:branched-chain amino acid transport system permease protein
VKRLDERRWFRLALLGAAALLPFIAQLAGAPFLVRAAGITGLSMVLGLGLNVTLGYVGLFDLGYVAFYGIGAYAAAIAAVHGCSFPLAVLLAVVVSVVLRALVGVTILRLRGDYLAVVTLGFGEIARLTFNNLDALTNGPKGLEVPPARLLGWTLAGNRPYYWLILAAVALSVLVSERLEHSRLGRAWVAIREDETAARLTGLPVARLKLLAFTISGAFAGVAGALFAYWEGFVTPESFIFWESILVVSVVVLGGMGSLFGVLLGAVILTGAPLAMQAFLSPALIDYRYLFFGVILVLVTLFRPEGLLPSRRRRAELSEAQGS